MSEISVIVPLRNEEQNVEANIKRLAELFIENNIDGEIIAVDDRSTDRTGEILERLREKIGFLEVVTRKGDPIPVEIGFAIRDGIQRAKGEATSLFMGDFSDDPKYLLRMIKKFQEGYDLVIGSRFVKGSETIYYPKRILLFNRLYNSLLRLLFGLRTNDITYSFKVYRTNLLKEISIESSGFEIFVELPLKVIKMRCRYVQIPTGWSPRGRGKSSFRLWDAGRRYILTAMRLRLLGNNDGSLC